MDALTDTEREMLAMERLRWEYTGNKDAAIVDRLGLSVTRYYQALNVLIDKPAALAHDPITVKRLQRLRARRQAVRPGRRAELDT